MNRQQRSAAERGVGRTKVRGRPVGCTSLRTSRNAHAVVLAKALPLAERFTRSGASRAAIAWLQGVLVTATDKSGRRFIASPIRGAGIDGRANRVRRVQAARLSEADRRWLSACIENFVVWLSCLKSGASCSRDARRELVELDPKWSLTLDRLESAICDIEHTKLQAFEIARLSPAMTALAAQLQGRR